MAKIFMFLGLITMKFHRREDIFTIHTTKFIKKIEQLQKIVKRISSNKNSEQE